MGRPSRRTRTALAEFLSTEVAAGAVLVTATVAALIAANSPWREGYEEIWRLEAWLTIHDWINEGLMALFFLVVGLEVKREFLEGELSDRRRATLPIVAAAGGMAVPALVYLVFNTSEHARGWGIPVATDIAFALGVLAVVAPRAPSSARVFLLALAIADDIGAIVVIAIVYSDAVDVIWLAAAVGSLLASIVFRRVTVAPFVFGAAMWFALHEAGVHATLAGVATAFVIPLRDVERLERRIHPWASYAIVPLFALANAGIHLSSSALSDAAGSAVATGVFLGLVVGKPVGIGAAAWIATRVGAASLPDGMEWRELLGVGALGGIGFTVSLFITALAFDDPGVATNAKIGVLAASVGASILAAFLLRGRVSRR